MQLLPEDEFPNFKANSTIGEIDLHEFIGDSWCVLFSYPNDFSSVSTSELAEAAKLSNSFERKNVKLIALSLSPVESNLEWLDDVKSYGGLNKTSSFPFPIVDDSNRLVSLKLGMIRPQDVDKPNLLLTARHCFIIGPDKKLKLAFVYPQSTGRDFYEILRSIDSLQLFHKYKLATPADWVPGEKCLVFPTVQQEELDVMYPKGVDTIMVPSGKHYLRVTEYQQFEQEQ